MLRERIITPVMKRLIRSGHLIEEAGMRHLGESDASGALRVLQSASCTYRIALGPRAGQPVVRLQAVPRGAQDAKPGCVERHVFSLHAAIRCGMQQRQELERLCR